jgi:hypothetical protein
MAGLRALPQHGTMARSQRVVAATFAIGATALLATACGSSLGYQTPCSVWVSMDNADQQATVNNLYHQEGQPDASTADAAEFERLADAYCADPLLPDDTIGGMRDSRPGT